MTYYEALSDRELDVLVAQRLLGWTLMEKQGYPKGIWLADTGAELPNGEFWPEQYSRYDNAARLVRNRIAELGLAEEFIRELTNLMAGPLAHLYLKMLDIFMLLEMPPRAQCIAALKAKESSR